MKNTFYALGFLLSAFAAKAQVNYVANTPNSTVPANQNTLVGPNAGRATMTGAYNTFLGADAGKASTSGPLNTFIGYQTGYSTTSGGSNVFIGQQSGYTNNSGSSNVFIGAQAGYSSTTGGFNVFAGSQAGANNTSGSYNMFMGNVAGGSNTTGSYNMAIGDGAGYYSNANQNTYIGTHAGFDNRTGNGNVFIGYQANVGGPNAGSLTNAIAIGANATVSASNALVLGNGVNVGVGTSTPGNKLEITSNTAGQSGLRLTNLTSSSTDLLSLTVSLLNPIVKVLTVDDKGDVKLAGLSVNLAALGGGRQAASTWETQGNYLQNAGQEGVIIGSGVTKTPSDYNLFVSKGILTEKVKVAVKNTDQWSDYVFAPNYKLNDLSKVDKYIKAHKHLPGIPSAQEMVDQGNDLHQTDARLLAKIEELTLYMIDIKRDNQRLKQAYSALKRQNQRISKKLNLTH